MKILIDIPKYDEDGIDVFWEEGADYKIIVGQESVIISANRNAMKSLAKQMLYFVQNDLPDGSHVHFDSFFTGRNHVYDLVLEYSENMRDENADLRCGQPSEHHHPGHCGE